MRADLPTGTVTFLFTDVEGSTKLLDELGADAYANALAEHRRVVREACALGNGAEVDTQGDAFFLAFSTAPGALEAAQAIADGLEPSPIRVRMGLHTGTPLLADEGYVGPDVHRAARIAASGHGGQILVSSATAALVEGDSLADLGEHRFKDLSAPERVYQLGAGDFPPLKSLYRTNLPVPATPFLGRETELAEAAALLRRDDVRLLTLTGPGGTGKTRLAVQAAGEASEGYPDGIWWVPLAPLRNARRLVSSAAQALDVEEGPGSDLASALAARLAGRQALLILDNAEHLLPAAAVEIARLRDIVGPTILVTSRERLQLQGEHLYAVPALAGHDGVDLFMARARALETGVRPSEAVGELCARLDNLPLALELAAARTVVFSPEQLLARLSERLDLLTAGRDADPRQQTLRATIEWSYDLLDDTEQAIFSYFAVFAGGATYDALEAVCGASPATVESLVDKSLLRRLVNDPPRFVMLETIRELAAEKLAASGELADVRRRHAEYYVAVARSTNLEADAMGPQRHDIAISERDNMRAALAWALESGERELGLDLVALLENYWATSLPEEGDELVSAFLDSAGEAGPGFIARALRVRGGMQNMLGKIDASERSWLEALAIHRALGDERGEAILLHRLSNTAARRGDMARMRGLAEESLAAFRRGGGFVKGEAQALGSLAWVARTEGDLEGALELLHESSALAEKAGFRWWHAGMLANAGEVLFELGRNEDASKSARAALAMSHAMHDRRGLLYELRLLARISASEGDGRLAETLLAAVDAENERAPVGGHWAHDWKPPEVPVRRPVDPERSTGPAPSLDDAVALALGDA